MSDTSSTTACPDAATLRALLDGTLPDDQQAATQTHVDRCPACEAALRQMTAGGESWIGMAEKLKGGSEDDPNLAAALDRLKADDSSGGEPSEPTDPQRTLDFLQPADDPKLLGKLGQHEISEVVGWGGMGVVLKAYDPSLHRVVAVKVLASHLAHHAVARKRFIREAQAAAAVCHDNVVTIHAIDTGFGEPEGVSPRMSNVNAVRGLTPAGSPMNQALPKIIMQFVAGGSLQERIDQEGPLELKEILRIAMQTAAGLAAAHAQGVVHRDVKPANILLENGVQRVKLTDFGLARVMDDASLTLSGVIAGTPQYMAPEQAWGRDVDARADLFSLGAVMYAMCSGHSPFRARTTMAVLKRVCEDAPRPLRAINPDVPEWLVAIIEKLLAKNPDERFQTATEVSELLSRWLAHVQQPSVAERPPLVGQVFNLPAQAATEKTLAGQVENLPHDRASRDSAAALLAMSEFERRPDELRYRIRLWESGLWAFAAIGIPIIGVLAVVSPMNYMDTVQLVVFGLLNVLATLILITVFRAAWKTTRWRTWIGSMFFLPAAGMGLLLVASDEPASAATKLVCSVQAVVALVFTIALMFSRPLLAGDSNRMPSERWSGWQRLFAILFLTVVGMPLVFVVTYWLSHSSRKPVLVEQNSWHDGTLMKTRPSQNDDQTAAAAVAKPLDPALPAELKGRWVVVSSEGAALGPIPAMGAMGMGSALGGPMTLGMFGGESGGGSVFSGGPGMSTNRAWTSPLQWIEFAADRVVTFDGREMTFAADVDGNQEPKRLALLTGEGPSTEERSQHLWRYGIYRIERDRLILCWTSNGQPVPTEFATDTQPGVQLLVLRREWNPPPNFNPSEALPPRAIIPFTADEAKRFQEAWARSANVPVETTNSLGLKLRVLPPGSFAPGGNDGLSNFPMRPIEPSFTQPIYIATHEVTVAQFRKFVEATQYETTAERMPSESGTERRTWQHPGIVQDNDQHPVVHVSWQDAQAFCRWLSDTEQQQYRLPTVTEWAFAARAGLASSTPLRLPHNARLRFFDTTAPVGGDNANLFGLHDLFGNVSEMANDTRYDSDENQTSPADFDEDELPPFLKSESSPLPDFHAAVTGGGFRSTRGRDPNSDWMFGSFIDLAGHKDDVGFRVARVITREVESLALEWPPVGVLIAHATKAAVSLKADGPQEADPKAPPDDSNKEPLASRYVVTVCGLVPIGSFSTPPNFVDVEIERRSIGLSIPRALSNFERVTFLKDLAGAVRNDTDPVPSLLLNPVFSMPLPIAAEPWPSKLVTHPLLPPKPPKSKYEVQYQLFRFLDFGVALNMKYSYRVRLKFTLAGKQENPPVLFTRWSNISNWAWVGGE